MKYRVRVIDDNNTQLLSLGAEEQGSIESLVQFVKITAGTPGYERFKKDSAVVVEDQAGNEIARADHHSDWKLPPLE